MSLIADALKAAQQEKQSRSAPPPPRAASYLSLRQTNRTQGINKSILIGAGSLAGVLLIGTIVAMKMASSPSVPTVREVPNKIVQPPQTPEPTPVAVNDSAVDTTAAITPSRPIATYNQPSVKQVAKAADTEEESSDTESTVVDKSVPRVTSRPASPPLTITMEPSKTGTGSNAFQQGVAAQNRGDLTSAKQLYMQALANSPNNAEIYNNLGEVYRLSGDVAQAEDSFREAIRVNQDFGPAWNNLGLLMTSSGRRQEAISAMQKAIKLEPANASTRANLATQYYNAKLYGEAKRLLEESIQLNPGLAEAHYTLGQTLEAQGDLIGAIKSYNSFLGLAGNRYAPLKDQVRIHLAQLESQLGGSSGSGGKTNAR